MSKTNPAFELMANILKEKNQEIRQLTEDLGGLQVYTSHPFFQFYMRMIEIYNLNFREKGDSWLGMRWVELMDRICVQFEDLQSDPDREDYYANMGNYLAMIWLNEFHRTEGGPI